jgi:hypothetical protein
MKRLVLGLATAGLTLVLGTAVAVSASKKEEAALAAARTQGMAEAPAVAQAAGIACQVTDARFVGKMADPKTKAVTNFYEIDCDRGVGFVLQAPAGVKPTAFSCVEANSTQPDGKPPSLPCKLPGNANPMADLAPLLTKAGVACTPDAARGIGQTPKNTFLEVSCQGGSGYVLQVDAPANPDGTAVANDCLTFDATAGNIKCTLHDAAYRLAVVDRYAGAANNGCVVKDRRYIGMSQGGSSYYEAACQDGKGYIYKVDKGQVTQTTSCEKAMALLGGCTLTDAKEAQTAQAGLYSNLSKKAGFDCQVSKYAPFPAPSGKDVVEMACANRPDGAVGIFTAKAETTQVVDCARAPIVGYRCSFSKPEASLKAVTSDLKKMGKTECEVSAVRVLGKTATGTTYLETACADGLKGYILEYKSEPLTPINAVGCAFSRDCALPGNK